MSSANDGRRNSKSVKSNGANGDVDISQESTSYSYSIRSTLAQSLVIIICSFSFFGIGTMITCRSIVIGSVLDAKEGLSINANQASWYGSLLFLCQPIGALIGTFLQTFVGRKCGMMLMNIPQLIAWIMLYETNSVIMLFTSIILMGMSVGLLEAPGIAYVNEISEPRYRGTATAFTLLGTHVGFTFQFFIAALFANWRLNALISCAVPVLSIIFLFVIPDSPMWLLSKDRDEEALNALCFLRGWLPKEDVQAEFCDLCLYVKKSAKSKNATGYAEGKSLPSTGISIATRKQFYGLESILDPRTLRPMILLCSLAFFTNCSVSAGVTNYVINIFHEIGTPVKAERLAFLSSVMSIVGSIVCTPLIKYAGRRKLCLPAIMGCSLISVSLGLCVYYQSLWTFSILWCSLNFFSSLGVSTMGWIFVGEVFPLKTRPIGIGICGTSFYFYYFLFSKTYFNLENIFGIHGIFIVYGLFGLIGFIYLFMFLPETEGKSLAQIEEIFAKNWMWRGRRANSKLVHSVVL